jgi:hypothetical protein
LPQAGPFWSTHQNCSSLAKCGKSSGFNSSAEWCYSFKFDQQIMKHLSKTYQENISVSLHLSLSLSLSLTHTHTHTHTHTPHTRQWQCGDISLRTVAGKGKSTDQRTWLCHFPGFSELILLALAHCSEFRVPHCGLFINSWEAVFQPMVLQYKN